MSSKYEHFWLAVEQAITPDNIDREAPRRAVRGLLPRITALSVSNKYVFVGHLSVRNGCTHGEEPNVRMRVCVLAATVCSGCFLLVTCKPDLFATFRYKPVALFDPSRCFAMVSSCRSDVKHGSRPGGSTLVVTRHCPVEMRRSNWWVSRFPSF